MVASMPSSGIRTTTESIFSGHCLSPPWGERSPAAWADNDQQGLDLKRFQLLYLIIDDGRSMIMVPADLKEINGNSW